MDELESSTETAAIIAEPSSFTSSEAASDNKAPSESAEHSKEQSVEPRKKRKLVLCAELDYKWAEDNRWDLRFPSALKDHDYAYRGRTAKYVPKPEDPPEPPRVVLPPLYDDEAEDDDYLDSSIPTVGISPQTVRSTPRHRLIPGDGEVLDAGIVTPQRVVTIPQSAAYRMSPVKSHTPGQVVIIRQDPSSSNRIVQGPSMTGGRAPIVAPSRGRTISFRSDQVVLPHEAPLPRNSISPAKITEVGLDGSPRAVVTPHKVRIIRQHPERAYPPFVSSRPPILAAQEPSSSIIRPVSIPHTPEKEEVLPPHIAEMAISLHREQEQNNPAQPPVNLADQFNNISKEQIQAKIEDIRLHLKSEEKAIGQPRRLRSPPFARVGSPPGRQRNASTSSNSSQPEGTRGARIRHPGSPPMRTNMDFGTYLKSVREQHAGTTRPVIPAGAMPVRNGVKSNLKKPAQQVREVELQEESPKRKRNPSKAESTGSNISEDNDSANAVRCTCGTEEDFDELGWVACDGCNVWQHCYCGGYDAKKEKRLKYYCDQCEPLHSRRIRRTPKESADYIKYLQGRYNRNRQSGSKYKNKKSKAVTPPPPTAVVDLQATRTSARKESGQTPLRGGASKNVKWILAASGTDNNFVGPQALPDACVKMTVAQDVAGLVAQRNIPAGTAVMEIVANQCLPGDIEKPKTFNPHVFYYDGLVDKSAVLTTAQRQENQIVLDARKIAHDGRFVRRCCRPNSTIKHIYANSQANFYIVTRQNINIKEEITIPFEAGYHPTNKKQCRCNGTDDHCLLEGSNFTGPGFCDQALSAAPVIEEIAAVPSASSGRTPRLRNQSASQRTPAASPVPAPAAVVEEAKKVTEEKSEEEGPVETPKSPRIQLKRTRLQSGSFKKGSDKEEVKEEAKVEVKGETAEQQVEEEETEKVAKTPAKKSKKEPAPAKKKSEPVKEEPASSASKKTSKNETPKKETPAEKKPVPPKPSELDLLREFQSHINYDVGHRGETREERKMREAMKRIQAEVDKESKSANTPVSKNSPLVKKQTPAAKDPAQVEQRTTPARSTRRTKTVEVKEETPSTSKRPEVKEEVVLPPDEPKPDSSVKSKSPMKNIGFKKQMLLRHQDEKESTFAINFKRSKKEVDGCFAVVPITNDFPGEFKLGPEILPDDEPPTKRIRQPSIRLLPPAPIAQPVKKKIPPPKRLSFEDRSDKRSPPKTQDQAPKRRSFISDLNTAPQDATLPDIELPTIDSNRRVAPNNKRRKAQLQRDLVEDQQSRRRVPSTSRPTISATILTAPSTSTNDPGTPTLVLDQQSDDSAERQSVAMHLQMMFSSGDGSPPAQDPVGSPRGSRRSNFI